MARFGRTEVKKTLYIPKDMHIFRGAVETYAQEGKVVIKQNPLACVFCGGIATEKEYLCASCAVREGFKV